MPNNRPLTDGLGQTCFQLALYNFFLKLSTLEVLISFEILAPASFGALSAKHQTSLEASNLFCREFWGLAQSPLVVQKVICFEEKAELAALCTSAGPFARL